MREYKQHRGGLRPPRTPLDPGGAGPGDGTRRDKEDRAGGRAGPARPEGRSGPILIVPSRPPGRRPGVQRGPGGPVGPPGGA